jgi:phosphohistidine phosphatase
MATLYLLRHAKSAWDDPTVEDHDRPLNKRGRRAAEAIGAYMGAHGLKPDLVLCSTAVRARQTLDLVQPHIGAPEIVHERGLYLAGQAAIIARLRRVDRAVEAVLLVGHEPGIGRTALVLSGAGSEAQAMARIRAKYPTGALAWIDLAGCSWPALGPGRGILIKFIIPNEL